MIETIPNPLSDKGIQRDIKEKIEEVRNRRPSYGCTLDENLNSMLDSLARWAYQEGFRVGWRVHETRTKK